ncbi:hypothetical protein SCUCBS95973_008395 [Sporothrix curviconia]|uniref:Uncharacterized protein n=1 Tax=Sporothrix curviconia TaxID=1260050 RepID=A0ABP0CMP7_9PEZI
MVRLSLAALAGLSVLASAQDSPWTTEQLLASRRPLSSTTSGTTAIPGRYIIELSPDSAVSASKSKRDLAARAASISSQIQAGLGLSSRVRHDYASVSGRFDGVSIDVGDVDDASATADTAGIASTSSTASSGGGAQHYDTLEDLRRLDGVANVWPVERILLNATAFEIKAAGSADSNSSWNPHAVTGVDRVHASGNTGAGQTVCVVDTGVQVDHPALTGRVMGRSLVTSADAVGGSTGDANAASVTDCTGHGTFVSSMITGSTADFVGSAPGAGVYMYKVFASCDGSTTSDLILMGILAADADGWCAAISVSAGSDQGYAGSPVSRVAGSVAADRLVVVAAGNEGSEGIFYASTPASGEEVISVGSAQAGQTLGWPATLRSSSGETFAVTYVTPSGARLDEAVEGAPVSFDTGDTCNPSSPDIPSTGSKVNNTAAALVIRRGICSDGKGYDAATAAGFGYYLLYDSYGQGVTYLDDVVESMTVYGIAKLFAVVTSDVGPWTSAQISAGHNVTLDIPGPDDPDAGASAFASQIPGAGQMSTYSSWGPTFENGFYPCITAPGGNVYGAIPVSSYAISSGTSFSTPYIAGVAALYFAARNGSGGSPADFKARLYSTASLLAAYAGDGLDGPTAGGSIIASVAPLSQQGAGLVDAAALVAYGTTVSPALIALNDTANRAAAHTVTLANGGTVAVTYNVSHVAAPSVQSQDEYMYPMEYYPPLQTNADAAGSLVDAPEAVTLAPGESKQVTLTFAPPASPSGGTVWSGRVVFAGDNGETVSVSYVGVETITRDWTAFPAAPPVFRYDSSDGYLYPVNYGNQPYRPAESDAPELYFVLRYGTYEYSFDLVGANWTTDQFRYPLPEPAVGIDAWYGAVQSEPDITGTPSVFPAAFPVRFSGLAFMRFMAFANGTAVPSGQYRLLSRSRRMFGDVNSPDGWQLYTSDPFWVQLGDDPIPGYDSSSSTSVVPSHASSTAPVSVSSTLPPSSVTLSSEWPPITSTSASGSASASASVPVSASASTSASASASTSPTGTLPTTTFYPISTPTAAPGVFFTNIDLSLRSNTLVSTISDPGVWLALHVRLSIPEPLPENVNAVASFALPLELTGLDVDTFMPDTGGTNVAASSFDAATGVYTLTFESWVTWHVNTTGDFYVTCKLSEAAQAEIKAGTVYVFEVGAQSEDDADDTFSPSLTYAHPDRSAIYEHIYTETVPNFPQNDTVYMFAVEVPASLAQEPWTSATLSSVQTEDNGYLCSEAAIAVGTAASDGSFEPAAGETYPYTDSSALSNTTANSTSTSTSSPASIQCSVKSLKLTYVSALDDGEILQLLVPALLGIHDYSTLTLTYSLVLELANGTATSMSRSLTYYALGDTSPYWVFTGTRYVAPTTTALSSSSTASITASSTASSSALATTSLVPIPSIVGDWPCRRRERTL